MPRLAAFPKGFFAALVERRMSVFDWIELAGGLDEAEATRWVVECLWELVGDAQAEGVVMCLENHYKDSLWEHRSSPRARAAT